MIDSIHDNCLYNFYEHLYKELETYFGGLPLATSDLFELKPSNLVNAGLAGAVVSAGTKQVPVIGGIASGVAHVVAEVDKARRLNSIKTIDKFLGKNADYVAKQLALQITLSYQWVIESLSLYELPGEELRTSSALLASCWKALICRDKEKLGRQINLITNKVLNGEPPTPVKVLADFMLIKLKMVIERIQSSEKYIYSQLVNYLMALLVTEFFGFDRSDSQFVIC